MNKKIARCLLMLLTCLFPLHALCGENKVDKDVHPVIVINAYNHPSGPGTRPIIKLMNMGRYAPVCVFANGNVSSSPHHPSALVDIDMTNYVMLPPEQILAQINTPEHSVYVYGSGHVQKRKTPPIGELMLGKRAWLLFANGNIKPKISTAPTSRL